MSAVEQGGSVNLDDDVAVFKGPGAPKGAKWVNLGDPHTLLCGRSDELDPETRIMRRLDHHLRPQANVLWTLTDRGGLGRFKCLGLSFLAVLSAQLELCLPPSLLGLPPGIVGFLALCRRVKLQPFGYRILLANLRVEETCRLLPCSLLLFDSCGSR